MMTTTPARAGKTFLVRAAASVGAAAAILACSPIASAEEPGGQCPPPEQQNSDQQQQCEQQQGLPGLPKLPDNSQQQPQQPAQQQPQQQPQQAPQQKAQQGDLADKNCWVVNGVPRWNAPGTAPAPAGPFDVVQWCPTFYGLQPH
jgi:hypothetical protein